MRQKKVNEFLLTVLLVIALLAPRIVDLVRFTAADEPFWLAVGANYYYALTHRELENTVYEYHPAVTTMWIGTGAMLVYFPEYRGLMNGYFVQEKSSFDEYLVENGKAPLDLLWWSRFLQVLVNVALFIVVYFLLRYVFDVRIAFAVLFLASFSPYIFGQSRMLNHESMVGLFSLISVLSIIAYLFVERRLFLLVLSAGAAAYANLTKSSAVFLLPVILAVVSTWFFLHRHKGGTARIKTMFSSLFIWLGAFLAIYFISWPGMWVAPGKMLYEVYGNAFSYAFQGARLSVTHGLVPSSFSFASAGSGFIQILVSILWRTTPITWLGLLFSIYLLFNKNPDLIPPLAKYTISFLILEAFACIGMFSVVQGRDQPHYVMAAYYCFEFVSAMGWVFIFSWLVKFHVRMQKLSLQAGLFLIVFCGQVAGLPRTYPYYYTYLNPIMLASNPAPLFYYGERMEIAAAYLAAKPGSQDFTALVYFSRAFSYYFPGDTLAFKPVMFEDKALLIEYLQKSDYLVMYAGLHERLPLLAELTPEKVIDLNGRPYVEIYRVSDIPASFFSE